MERQYENQYLKTQADAGIAAIDLEHAVKTVQGAVMEIRSRDINDLGMHVAVGRLQGMLFLLGIITTIAPKPKMLLMSRKFLGRRMWRYERPQTYAEYLVEKADEFLNPFTWGSLYMVKKQVA